MLKLDNTDCLSFVNYINHAYSSASNAPLLFENSTNNTINKLYESLKVKYPIIIKIPKSIDRLLQGDFEPALEIIIEEPIRNPEGAPIWFMSSRKGVILPFGYRNGDSRLISDKELNDKFIHMLLVGKTGFGKSVTTNAIIGAIATLYAPWEVKMTMIDAKIVEFKTYGTGKVMPHISTIGATGDGDYVISALDNIISEMSQINAVFTKAGVKNIEKFREHTGLCLPQNIIFTDEFQMGFKNAGKRAPQLSSKYDTIARLGRNTGYHLYLASQELGSDLASGTMNQIGIRCALGCSEKVSEQILGNNEASSILQKGILYVNQNPDGHAKSDNIMFRVPYQSDKCLADLKSYLSDMGDKFNFRYPLNFYNELDVFYEDSFREKIKSFANKDNTIYLGEPSYIEKDKDKFLKLVMDGSEVENIMVLCDSVKHLERYTKTLKINFEIMKDRVNHFIFIADNFYESKCALSELSGNLYKLANCTDDMWMVALYSVYNRKLMIDADDYAFKSMETNDITDEVFYSLFAKGCEYDTELNRARCFALCGLLNQVAYMTAFDMANLGDEQFVARRNKRVEMLIKSYKNYNSATTKLELKKLPQTYVWLCGLEKVYGYGKKFKTSNIEKLRDILMESSEYGVRFIILAKTFGECNGMLEGIRYFIFDETTASEVRKCKCDDYPEVQLKVLGILYDRLAVGETKVKKFKKLYLEGEVPSAD